MSIFYHGSDTKQCWEEPSCLVCLTKELVRMIRFRNRLVKAMKAKARGEEWTL